MCVHLSLSFMFCTTANNALTERILEDQSFGPARCVIFRLSRTRDLVNQIKQITIEIRDIKERSRNKIDSQEVSNTINVRNHILSGPLPDDREEHEQDGVHYADNIRNNHPQPHNRYTQTHCVPTQYPIPTRSTSLPPLPPELHPSSPSNGNPVKPVSSTTPWSKKPNDSGSPEIVGDNVGGVRGNLLCGTNGMTSGDASDVGPGAD